MTAPSAKFYWLGQALGWGLFLIVNVLFAWSYQRNQATAFSLVYVWSALTGIAVTHFWRNWIRRHGWMESGRASNLSKLAGGVVAVGLAQCGSTTLAYAVIRPPGTSFEDLRWLPGALLVWICMAAIWTALYGLGYAIRRARQAELGRLNADIIAKDAALRALKAQINPHFFFNSLNSVRALVFIDQEAAARMIDQIVALMRYALDSQQSDTVPLSEELRIVRTYLMVEKTRFQSRLVIEEQIESQVETWPVPPMILQTLVENAVKYGTATSAGQTTVRLTIHADQERLAVEIANSGRLATSSQSTGLGLSNARRRLTLLYGASAELNLTEKAGWVVASLQLPRPLP